MQTLQSQPSLSRLWRQLTFIPMLHTKWLSEPVMTALTQAVTDAERGHQGEVKLIVENTLPIHQAYTLTPRLRALALFAEHRIWDTQNNTGVLVYLNICEHALEIVADRGINAAVPDQQWQQMCDDTVARIRQGDYQAALADLLHMIGNRLRDVDAIEDNPEGNEISDAVVHLK